MAFPNYTTRIVSEFVAAGGDFVRLLDNNQARVTFSFTIIDTLLANARLDLYAQLSDLGPFFSITSRGNYLFTYRDYGPIVQGEVFCSAVISNFSPFVLEVVNIPYKIPGLP